MSILWSLWTVLRLEDPVEIDLATGFFAKMETIEEIKAKNYD